MNTTPLIDVVPMLYKSAALMKVTAQRRCVTKIGLVGNEQFMN